MSAASALIQIPGTTSNLGPGFDTLGLALKLHNLVCVTRAGRRGVIITSPLAADARDGATAMLAEAARVFFRRARQTAFGLEVDLSGAVPIARGLGSSVTARLGVAAGLNELCGQPLDRTQLLELVTALEHHPDNAAPAIFGGFCVAGMLPRGVRCLRFPVSPRLKFVTLIPRFEVGTEAARKLLPATYARADTVHNLNRAALITAAFAHRDPAALRGLFDDRVHQPYRASLIPPLFRVIRAGERAGAIGGWLSGSGSTIICLTVDRVADVARAMQRELPESDVRILSADNTGYRVRPVRGTFSR